MTIDLEELISYHEYERSIDPDYNPESDSEYNSSSEEESDEEDGEPEEFEVNPSMNGFCSIS